MIILRYHENFFRLTAPRCPGMAAGAVSLRKSHDIVILSFCNIVKGQANDMWSLFHMATAHILESEGEQQWAKGSRNLKNLQVSGSSQKYIWEYSFWFLKESQKNIWQIYLREKEWLDLKIWMKMFPLFVMLKSRFQLIILIFWHTCPRVKIKGGWIFKIAGGPP